MEKTEHNGSGTDGMDTESNKKISVGRVVRIAATSVVFLVIGLFIIRCCMVADKSRFSSLEATDAVRSAFSDGESTVYTVKVESEMAEDGYFAAYGFYYLPESGEVQFAVRWNRSVYRYTDMPEDHEFSFYLLNETTGQICPAVSAGSDSMSIYQYRKMLAEGVELGEEEQLTAVMVLRDGFESRQVLKYAEQKWTEYTPKAKLLEEMKG